jgi:hypothetical protein
VASTEITRLRTAGLCNLQVSNSVYQVTSFDKLIIAHFIKKSSHTMKFEDSLAYPQEFATEFTRDKLF